MCILQDSTQIALNEHLAEEFKGAGGSASKSSVKIDLLYEAVHHILKEVSITKGTYPDQKNGAKVLKHIGEIEGNMYRNADICAKRIVLS